jgi:hypothetical protein
VFAQAARQTSSDRHTGVSQIMRVSSGKANSSVHAIRRANVPRDFPTIVSRAGS